MEKVAVFRRSKTEGETVRAAFCRISRTSSAGGHYTVRPALKQAGRQQVSMIAPKKERDGEETDSDSYRRIVTPAGTENGGREALAMYRHMVQTRSGVVRPISRGTFSYRNREWIDPRPRTILQRGKPRAPTPPSGQKVVCWRCYTVGEHFASACSLDLRERANSVMANFEDLSTE